MYTVGGCRFYEGELIPTTQPMLVTGGILRPYQLEGVEWLNVLYENGVNGEYILMNTVLINMFYYYRYTCR